MVLERRLAVAGRVGLRDPQLDAVQLPAVGAGRLLGVRDAVTGGHQVELARSQHLVGAETVPVPRLARDEPCDRLQPDVRVRADVEAVTLGDRRRPEVVGEAPRADRAVGPTGQGAPDAERPDLGRPAGQDLDLGAGHDAVDSAILISERYPAGVPDPSPPGVGANAATRVGVATILRLPTA